MIVVNIISDYYIYCYFTFRYFFMKESLNNILQDIFQ
nr:MAG TPA: hypothetical protein [Caudoviricetes sp.]